MMCSGATLAEPGMTLVSLPATPLPPGCPSLASPRRCMPPETRKNPRVACARLWTYPPLGLCGTLGRPGFVRRTRGYPKSAHACVPRVTEARPSCIPGQRPKTPAPSRSSRSTTIVRNPEIIVTPVLRIVIAVLVHATVTVLIDITIDVVLSVIGLATILYIKSSSLSP